MADGAAFHPYTEAPQSFEGAPGRLRLRERPGSERKPAMRHSPAFDIMAQTRKVAQIAFLEWTGADHPRHTKFVRLRDDKDPRKVVRET